MLLVGSQRALAQALVERLDAEPDIEVVGVAGTLPQSRASILWMRADVVLLDSDVRVAGVELAKVVRPLAEAARIVVLADEDCEHDVVPLVLAGIAGWVDKSDGIDDLLAAIRGAARGHPWIPPRALALVLSSFRQSVGTAGPGMDQLLELTRRERDVLALMAAGLPRAEIAAELGLSENTVRTHAQNVLRKLGVHSSLAAVALARRAGLATWPALESPVGARYPR